MTPLLDKNSMATASTCCVSSHNEWDPLEEVIVGIVDNAMFPAWNTIFKRIVPPGSWKQVEDIVVSGGTPYPEEFIAAAQTCLKEFVHILEAEGVTVRRPDSMNFAADYATPSWQVDSGFCAANPRDAFIVVGNQIIEAPMADRGRYFESWPYRSLLKEYFKQGARWVSAPKPQLLDAQFDSDYQPPHEGADMKFVTTEFEPTFDAADFVRCGRDLFGQKSHVTNDLGIEWLRRHLGSEYRIHILESRCPQAMHIDTTFMPLAPGKVLVNPEFLDIATLPKILDSWDILVSPTPLQTTTNKLGVISGWVNMNVLMLDRERVIVEKNQEPMIRAFEDWGFKPIPCSFENYYPFAGSFHCATLDVRRRGDLQSYF
ncbi:amidinotransferase [cf. Phormidesmis sp. LEGE 11477]|nr:amidinotransferase [cf. Phormidesmis sp. LEGE 11477]